MTVYVIVQLKMTDRAAYDRYQARFFDVFRKFNGRLLSADESPSVVEGDWNRDKLVLMSFSDETTLSCLGGLAGISGNLEGPQGRCARHRAAGEGICASGLIISPRPKAKSEEERRRRIIWIRTIIIGSLIIIRPRVVIRPVVRTIDVTIMVPIATPRAEIGRFR